MVAEFLDPGVARVYRRFGGHATYYIRTFFKQELQNHQLYDIDRDGNDPTLLLEVTDVWLTLPDISIELIRVARDWFKEITWFQSATHVMKRFDQNWMNPDVFL